MILRWLCGWGGDNGRMLKTNLPVLGPIDFEIRLLNGRLERAGEHLTTFGKLWDEYLAGRPHGLNHVPKPDGTLAVCLHRRTPLPVELSLVLGEFVYELRAALDNCLYAAAVLVSEKNPPPNAARLEWPIRKDAKEWKQQANRYQHLPADIRNALERIQPYQAQFPEWNSLAILHDLARIDRHRSPHGLGLYLSHLRLRADPSKITVIDQGRPGIVHDGGEIVRLQLEPGVELSPENFDVNLEFEVDVSDAREAPGPSDASGRPWGSLHNRMRSVIKAVDMYTAGILAHAIDNISGGDPDEG